LKQIKSEDIEMAKYRRGRINDAVAQELAIALGEVREPKVVNNFISITRAEVAPDLKYATVYFSCIGDGAEAAAGLKKCTGMLRHHLAVTLNLRITPELNFVKDGSIEHGAKIARLLEEVMGNEKDGK
jgi:ribosome-binding factor A